MGTTRGVDKNGNAGESDPVKRAREEVKKQEINMKGCEKALEDAKAKLTELQESAKAKQEAAKADVVTLTSFEKTVQEQKAKRAEAKDKRRKEEEAEAERVRKAE